MIRFEQAEMGQGASFEMRADWSLPGAQIVAVIGPSGAGKSTLLMTLAGFVPLHAGALWLDQRDASLLDPADRPVSLVFQDHNLFPHLSINQNVGLGLRPDLRLTAEQKDEVADALGRVGLAGLGERRPSAVSGGQQARVALARALLRDRPVLLLDEPFAALGPALRHDMLALVRQLQKQQRSIVLLVTHDPQDALTIADQTIWVSADGTAYEPQPTKALFANPPAEMRAYLGL